MCDSILRGPIEGNSLTEPFIFIVSSNQSVSHFNTCHSLFIPLSLTKYFSILSFFRKQTSVVLTFLLQYALVSHSTDLGLSFLFPPDFVQLAHLFLFSWHFYYCCFRFLFENFCKGVLLQFSSNFLTPAMFCFDAFLLIVLKYFVIYIWFLTMVVF